MTFSTHLHKLGSCAAFLAFALTGSALAQDQLPVYEVTGNLVPSLKKMTKGALDSRSVYSYYPSKQIELIPQRQLKTLIAKDENTGLRATSALDLAAFRKVTSIPRATAARLAAQELQLAGIKLANAKPIISESQLAIRDTKGNDIATRNVETIVSYQMSLSGIPAEGPGFKARFAYAPSGELSQAYVYGRTLRQGPMVPIISKEEAMRQAEAMFGHKNVKLNAKLVYYLPSPDFQPTRIYPHYEIGGTMQVGNEVVELRRMFVPAVQKHLTASIDVKTSGGLIDAKANIVGGRAPYRLDWASDTTDLAHVAFGQNAIRYKAIARPGLDSIQESLRLVVTDADGLQAIARVSPRVITLFDQDYSNLWATTKPVALRKAKRNLTRDDAGIEYIDWATNANNCRSEMNAQGLPVQFFFSEMGAWEQDFKKESAGGTDSSYVDDVDLTFYTGHANGDGFVFKSNVDDTFLHYNDASWGERDAEWIVIAACGPLQPTEGGRNLSRWLPAFQGLHILMGYGNISYNSNEEGRKFVNRALRTSSPMRIRDAWISTAAEEQPASVLMGLMGVVRSDGAWNWDDYFWGRGVVGPDIPASQVTAYWYYVVPC